MGPGFEAAYRELRVPLVRFAYLLCGSQENAEDVVQAAFTSAHDRWQQVADPAAYLRRAVLNLVKDGQRRRFRLVAALQRSGGPSVELPPEVDETWGLIERLPWPQRAVVVLRYYDDLPFAEIAEALDRPESTVRSDHRRALAGLRKALS